MVYLLLISYAMLFISTMTGLLKIGWLFISSFVLCFYCLIVICSEIEKLTDIGKWIFSFAVIGVIYSIMAIFGFNVNSLF